MADHRISLTVSAEKEAVLKIVYSLEDAKQDADVIFKEMKQYQKTLKEQAGLSFRRSHVSLQKVQMHLFPNGSPQAEARFLQDIRFSRTGEETR